MNYLGTIAYRSAYMGMIHEGFMASFIPAWDRLRADRPGAYYFDRGLGPHSMAANALAEKFKGDWLLMLDTDHVFGSDFFLEMVETFDEFKTDVLVAFTQKRQAPYHPVLFKTDFEVGHPPEVIFPAPHTMDLIPIDSSGAACLMVRRYVFDRLHEYNSNGPFDVLRPDLGEDASFFYRVKMAGLSAFCASWIKYYHLETRLVTEDLIVKDPQNTGFFERLPGLKPI